MNHAKDLWKHFDVNKLMRDVKGYVKFISLVALFFIETLEISENNFREVFTKSTSPSIVHLIHFSPFYQFHLPQSISFFSFIKVHLIHFSHIRVVQKKRAILFLILKLCFTIVFRIFQVVQTAGLGDSFDTNMDPTGRFTTQQPIKIIDAYCTTKSVLLTQRQYRRDFGRSNVLDRRTTKSLVAKLRETGSVEEAPQSPTSFKLLKSNKLSSFSNL